MAKLFQVKGECFRAYFANIVSNLIGVINRGSQDPVIAAINMFQNHPSVVNIKQREFNKESNFDNTNENEVRKIIKNLIVRKTYPDSYTFQQKSWNLI